MDAAASAVGALVAESARATPGIHAMAEYLGYMLFVQPDALAFYARRLFGKAVPRPSHNSTGIAMRRLLQDVAQLRVTLSFVVSPSRAIVHLLGEETHAYSLTRDALVENGLAEVLAILCEQVRSGRAFARVSTMGTRPGEVFYSEYAGDATLERLLDRKALTVALCGHLARALCSFAKEEGEGAYAGPPELAEAQRPLIPYILSDVESTLGRCDDALHKAFAAAVRTLDLPALVAAVDELWLARREELGRRYMDFVRMNNSLPTGV